MSKQRNRIMMGVAAGVGAAAVVYGVSRWMASRPHRYVDLDQLAGDSGERRNPALPRQRRTAVQTDTGLPHVPADQPDRNPQPLTGGRSLSPGLGEPTEAPVPGAPTGFPAVTRSTRLSEPGVGPGEGDRRADLEAEEQSEVAMPVTGSSVEAAATWGVVSTEPGYRRADLEGVLVEYLIGFHRMIETLRARRKETGGDFSGPGSSLTPSDRVESQELVVRMEDALADYSEADFQEDMDSRLYRLAVKVRDALQNLEYSDDDLFRLYGEVRTEACQVMAESGPGMERVQALYECQGG